eukprot:CAMPEP_0117667644 /NCGR_PEP_ID=MMETSP0804-20121206/11088_1 /TAXON_ID=1074897 /ORGANISM="Tetraselmis astigmatica, Strain CCMP880" /LENGTH=33 /DNA_ID= /DNA_START= /DNA_END= /DNA_ORIENTATION=
MAACVGTSIATPVEELCHVAKSHRVDHATTSCI